jgi:hypothetical protein
MNPRKPEPIDGTREEVRELAEALSLFRSAVRHIAEREALHPAPALPPARSRYIRLLLQPALLAPVMATAIFFASLPVYRHFRPAPHPAIAVTASGPSVAAPNAGTADAELMTQIDAEVSEDVPDALQPMADFGSASPLTQHTSSAMEKNHVTQE